MNTQTAGDQLLADVGALAGGGHAVAWRSQDGSLWLRRFDAAGQPVSAGTALPFTAPDAGTPGVQDVSLAVLPDGGVVVAYALWRELPGTSPQRARTGVYWQRFDASGQRVTAETAVSELEYVPNYRSPGKGLVQAIALSDGGFVVGWADIAPSSVTIRFTLSQQHYAANGLPVGTATILGRAGSPGDASLRLQADAQGGWTAAVYQQDESYQPANVLLQFAPALRLTVSGAPEDSWLLALTGGRLLRVAPQSLTVLDADGRALDSISFAGRPLSATELADGGFLLVAQLPDGRVQAERFDANAQRLGSALQLDAGGGEPQLAALSGGGALAAWSSARSGDFDVYAQRLRTAP